MLLLRYPDLITTETLKSSWEGLIRVLRQRDTYQPTIRDVFGQITPTSLSYQMLPTDAVIVADTTLGAITVFIPKASQGIDSAITIKNYVGAHNVTIQAAAGENIDGSNTLVLSSAGQRTLRSDGFQWWVISA